LLALNRQQLCTRFHSEQTTELELHLSNAEMWLAFCIISVLNPYINLA